MIITAGLVEERTPEMPVMAAGTSLTIVSGIVTVSPGSRTPLPFPGPPDGQTSMNAFADSEA